MEEIQEWSVEERSLLQLWHQRPSCKRISQEKKDLKNKFKGSSHVAIINKIVFVIVLFISLVCKDAWFIDSGTSQHLTFQKEILQRLKNFLWITKYILEMTICLMYMGKAIFSSTCQMVFLSVLEMCCMSQSW